MRKLKLALSISAVTLAISAIVFIASCKKSDNTTAADTASTNYAGDQAVAEKSYDDVQTIAENANGTGGSSVSYRTMGLSGYCNATVTRDTSGGVVTMTINFGSTDCTGHDNRARRGEIIVTYPATGWFTVNGTRTITFNNYYQNDNAITGTKTVTYLGLNSANEPVDSVTINGTITYTSGKTVTVNWTRHRTWMSGFRLTGTTPVWTSGISYAIYGAGTMTSSTGQQVDINISSDTPLIFAFDCQWIEAGTISYTLVSDNKIRSLNYGTTANCDDQAVLTLANGTTVNITLP